MTEPTTEQSLKCVKVSYHHYDCFVVPKNINLEDKTQVKEWWVKYNTLHILLTNGKHIEIESQGWDNNYKYPDEQELLEYDEVGCIDEDDEGFEPVNLCNDICTHGLHCDCCKECYDEMEKEDDEDDDEDEDEES